MKILAIRIRNLASLEGNIEIDFTKEPLHSAGIFAITGVTGAGKSTILDALCLALYAKTPRYEQANAKVEVQGAGISQNDARGILRDGTTDAYAEVEFVGIDQEIYVSTWTVRRARNKVDGSLQDAQMSVCNKETKISFPAKKTETLKEIERLVGLNFEQFTRSVLLAQGEFTAFLKADIHAKSSLLEKLTGTHIYTEISKLIFEKNKEAQEVLQQLRLQMEGIEILSEAEMQILQEEKKTTEQTILQLEKALEQLDKEITWKQNWKDIQERKNKLEDELQFAINQKNEIADTEKLLVQVEQVQAIKSVFEAKLQSIGQQDALQARFQQLQEKNTKQKDEIELMEKEVSILETQQIKVSAEFADAKPQIEKAKQLDTILIQKENQLAHAKIDEKNALLQKQQTEKKIEENNLKIVELKICILKITTWQNENISREIIAKNINLIADKLSTLQSIQQDNKKQVDSLDLVEKQKTKLVELVSGSTSELQKNQTATEELQEQINKQSQQLQIFKIEDIKAKENEYRQKEKIIISANGLWKILYQTELECQQKATLLEKRKTELDNYKLSLIQTKDNLSTAKIKREAIDQQVSKMKLLIAESVTEMRSHLTDGEECPVCGSKEHPFAQTRDLLSTKMFEELEAEQKLLSAVFEKINKEYNRLEQSIESLSKQLVDEEKELTLKNSQLLSYKNEWQNLEIYSEIKEIQAAEMSSCLSAKETELNTAMGEVQIQLQNFAEENNKLEILKNNLNTVEKNLQKLSEQHQSNIHQQGNNTNEITRIKNSIEELANKTNTQIADLNNYFQQPNWIQHWEKDANDFENKLNLFAKTWNENNESLLANNNSLNLATAAITQYQSQYAKDELDWKNKVNNCKQFHDEYHQLFNQRQEIFEGKKIEAIELVFKVAVDNATEEYDKNNSLLATRQIEKAKTDGECLQVENEIKKQKEIIIQQKESIQHWLQNYNTKAEILLDEIQLSSLMQYTHAWINTTRNDLQKINDKVKHTHALLQENNRTLQEHINKKISDKEENILLEDKEKTKENLNIARTDKHKFESRILMQAENEKKAGNLQSQINEQQMSSSQWAKLNELLGSADGKKFRQYAQEYTLDVLLSYANIHLKNLADRYQLSRIPNTLGLQIMDCDMGNEIRTVYSLSGGESFLVSLALALGLASLSSNKMKVESLFIDEGFGSLDATTLSIAMDALEQLHNQGRKVGVISHVQEMTERIPTQIHIYKLSNGKSKLEIIG